MITQSRFLAVTMLAMVVITLTGWANAAERKAGLLALRNVYQVRVKIRKVSPTHLRALVAARNLY